MIVTSNQPMETLNKFAGVLALVAIIIAIGGYNYPQASQETKQYGNITDTSYFDYFNAATGGGFQINGTNVHTASSLVVPTAGGTLNVTTSNTATSTMIAGCWQFYATSTATALKYMASTTPGIMYSQYGTCP